MSKLDRMLYELFPDLTSVVLAIVAVTSFTAGCVMWVLYP